MAEDYTPEAELARLTELHRRRMIKGQLYDEITTVVINPACELLGEEARPALAGLADRRAEELTEQLTGEDRLAAHDAARAMVQLARAADTAWWRSPLGQAYAAAGVTAPSETITQAEAARRLGVTRGRVAQLVKAGKIATSSDGQPLLASVLDRMLYGGGDRR